MVVEISGAVVAVVEGEGSEGVVVGEGEDLIRDHQRGLYLWVILHTPARRTLW